MPLVYRAECSHCKNSAGGHDVDVAVKLDDGRTEILRHPLETHDLERLGYTWEKARMEGRLFWVFHYVCEGCGERHDVARKQEATTGCTASLLWVAGGWAAAFLLGYAFFGPRWYKCFWVALVASFGFMIVRSILDSQKESAINLAVDQTERCRKCGGSKFVSLPAAKKKLLPCPKCGTKSMRYDSIGIS